MAQSKLTNGQKEETRLNYLEKVLAMLKNIVWLWKSVRIMDNFSLQRDTSEPQVVNLSRLIKRFLWFRTIAALTSIPFSKLQKDLVSLRMRQISSVDIHMGKRTSLLGLLMKKRSTRQFNYQSQGKKLVITRRD